MAFPDPTTWKILYSLVFFLLIIIILLSILTLYLHHLLREKVSSIFISSLCVGVLLRAVSVVIRISFHVFGSPILKKRTLWLWTIITCSAHTTLCSVSAINLSLLALDRYLAICHCLRYYSLVSFSTSFKLVSGSWLVPIVLQLPLVTYTFLEETDYEYSTTVELVNRPFILSHCITFLVCAVFVMMCYVLIALELHHTRREVLPDQLIKLARHRIVMKSTWSTIKVTALFFLLYFPYILVILAYEHPPTPLFRAALTGQGLHVLLLFPVYTWNNSTFKDELEDWMEARIATVRRLYSD